MEAANRSLSGVEGNERNNPRTAQSFTVSKDEIAATGYDLSLNRYKEVVHEQIDHISPAQLIAELKQLDSEIQAGLVELEGMLASDSSTSLTTSPLSQRNTNVP